MNITFNNLTITVEAETPEEAYQHLGELLVSSIDLTDPPRVVSWRSDTFTDPDTEEERDTLELIPDDER